MQEKKEDSLMFYLTVTLKNTEQPIQLGLPTRIFELFRTLMLFLAVEVNLPSTTPTNHSASATNAKRSV